MRLWSPLLKTSSAAARRVAGSGLIKVSEPSAARMTPRSRLLILIFSRASLGAAPASALVTGSLSAKASPDFLAMTTTPSALRT